MKMVPAGLGKLLNRRRLTIIGLNSGTSADGIDAAAVTISRTADRIHIKSGPTLGRRFPKTLRERILAVADAPTVDPAEIIYLSTTLGKAFGRAAATLRHRLRVDGVTVHAVASHGQTVRHLPSPNRYLGRLVRGTLQLGSLDHIAAITGLVTIGDFRQADIAVGGEGAPITTGAMRRLLPPRYRSRLIVNIGGMSNFFYFASRKSSLIDSAIDCGPGNSLIDILAQKLFGRSYDRNGALARRGRLSGRLLSLVRVSPDKRQQTISTGREQFGPVVADEILRRGRQLRLSRNDIIRAATELTALAIADATRPLLEQDHNLRELYLTGGGRLNKFLMHRLEHYLPGWPIRLIDETGFDGDYLEATSFAVMGEACLRSESLSVRPDGCEPVLGHVVQPPCNSHLYGRK